MRRIVDSPGYIEIEMDEMPSWIPSGLENIDSHHPSNNNDVLLCGFERGPIAKKSDLKDDAQIFADQFKAGFSPKETALSAIETVPNVLKELGHQLPGVGALLATGFLAGDIADWQDLQQHIRHVRALFAETTPAMGNEEAIRNTLAYAIAQLERRSSKLVDSIIGKTLQATGSILTFAGLFTHGITAIPGLMIGLAGTGIKLRVTVRSAFNNIKKRIAHELSVNRENHARYLYGLTLLHLHRLGAYNGDYSKSREAKKSIELVQNMAGDNHNAARIAAEFVGSMRGLEFFKCHALTTTETEHFLEYGLWKIMLGIKS